MFDNRKYNDRFLVHGNVYFIPKGHIFTNKKDNATFIINALAFMFFVLMMAGCIAAYAVG